MSLFILTMALWNHATWNSTARWSVPDPSPQVQQQQRQPKLKTVKRQRFFPSTVDARPDWFATYATQLPIANAILGLPAGDVTASVNDARYCQYACGAWLSGARDLGPASTAAIETLFSGAGADPIVLPVFTVPALPAGVTAVAPGALDRIFAFVQVIKTSANYVDSIGMQLGIVGAEDAADHPVPEFFLKLERGSGCQCVKVVFKKFGRQGVLIQSRRGGGPWEMLAIDLASPYLDERPLLVAGQPEVREYRLQFYDDAKPVGDFTDVSSVTVTP